MQESLEEILSQPKPKWKEGLEVLQEHLSDGRVIKWKELLDLGVSKSNLVNFIRRDVLEKTGWGTYQLGFDYRLELESENSHEDEGKLEEYAEVLSRSSRGVICLLSACRYHNLSVESPSEIWLGIPHGSHAPKIEYPPIKPVFWRRENSLTLGVEVVRFGGRDIRITNLERTVVDLYLYQSRLRDSTLPRKVLSEAMRRAGFSRNDLLDYSRALKAKSKIQQDIELLDLVVGSIGKEDQSPEQITSQYGISY